MKKRLDLILVERGLSETREKAKREIMAGNVFVNGQAVTKAGTNFSVLRIPICKLCARYYHSQ